MQNGHSHSMHLRHVNYKVQSFLLCTLINVPTWMWVDGFLLLIFIGLVNVVSQYN
jgi:hypothetical protein